MDFQKPQKGRRSKTGYRGVTFFAGQGKYRAYIYLPGTRHRHIGTFDTAELAARAHDAAAVERFGPDAVTNASLGLFSGAHDAPQVATTPVPSVKAAQRGSGHSLAITNRHMMTSDFEWLLEQIESPTASALFGNSPGIREELASLRNMLYREWTARQDRRSTVGIHLDTSVDKRLSPGECRNLGLAFAALVRRVRAGETSGAPCALLCSLAAAYLNSAARRYTAAGVKPSFLESVDDIRQLYAGPVQARPRERPNPGAATPPRSARL
jgi:hypothetical protein